MPIYEYKCRNCSYVTEEVDIHYADSNGCPMCDGSFKRVYTFSTPPTNGFVPHFNHSIGEHVSSQKDFESKLKQKGDKEGKVFTPIHPTDMKDTSHLGVTTEGLDSAKYQPKQTSRTFT